MTDAAAWREVEVVLDNGEGLWPLRAAASAWLAAVRSIDGDPEADREGGSEFKSGAMGAVLMELRPGRA